MSDIDGATVNKFEVIRLVAGLLLLAACLYISYFDSNHTTAAFFFVVGILCFIDYGRLKTLTFGGVLTTELYEKMEKRVENAESILTEIRDIEARIAYVMTQQMLNRGGERYVGGFGEEAEFAIFRGLRETKAAKTDPEVKDSIAELKKQLGFQLCHGIFGTKWMDDNSKVREWALKNRYEVLPDARKVLQLAKEEGFDASTSPVYEPYLDFIERNILPSERLIRALYDCKNSSRP
ncbi:hypothetical protein [Rhizobium laguerreae]|uniref:hypothetical protein n=1 Tax=Rhizobium laguerreae TaxID=1076926 RepID=UPI0014424647|nr:hypothetical protein [Rhizobium laguerreae]NKM69391.1 hypothetical protein [Rhizobium laguerreae]